MSSKPASKPRWTVPFQSRAGKAPNVNPFALTRKERLQRWFKLNGNPYLFLVRVWHLLSAPLLVCALFLTWHLVHGSPEHFYWLHAAGFLICGPMDMATRSCGHLSDTRKRHAAISLFNGVSVAFLGFLVQRANPTLVGLVVWLMLMLCVYNARLLEFPGRLVEREKYWLVFAILGGLAALVWGPVLPWLAPLMLGAVVAVHRTRLWMHRRDSKEVSLEQHETVWPREARKDPPAVFWSSLLLYITINEPIPAQALRKALKPLDIETLLDYFIEKSKQDYPQALMDSVWSYKDLDDAVKERICALDEHAGIVFEVHGKNTEQAAMTVRELRSGKTAAAEQWELPEL